MTTIPRYLDPRNDIPFKKVFGQHKHLCISLLNSLLPLEGREIIEIEYLPLASLPRIDSFRTSILDVRCEDSTGRQFLVEMQMYWSDSFTNRVTFNASKAYIAQFDKEDLKNKVDEMGKTKPYLRKNIYKDIQPVYSLNLINDSFENTPEMAKEYYHHYAVVNLQHTEKRIEGLELIFVELPKFKPSGRGERKLHESWLRYFQAAAALAAEQAAAAEAKRATARTLRAAEVSAEVIAQSTGLDAAEIAKL
ncbi:MAG: Rpn family recombination-promoting nuclease/putative transposase [Puniceicoccales bacterium]|nr:Rpn family recombination-promoting nuclease/putative transposase [Puniceicoccales bacterium]